MVFVVQLWRAGLAETGALYSFAWPLLVVSFGAMVVVPLTLDVMRRHGFPLRVPAGALVVALILMAVAAERDHFWVWPLPWLLVTVAVAVQALREFLRGPRQLGRAVVLSGPAMLAVGGAWYFADRTGMEPLGFDGQIVRLTAAHFHFAGFVLPVVAGLVLRWRAGMLSRVAALGVLGGVPMVATGITLTRLGWPVEVECGLALVFSFAAFLTGLLMVATAAGRNGGQQALVRGFLGVAGVSLAAGMTLAILYGLRPWVSLPWLQNYPRMWAWHGTIQVFGFSIPALLAWRLWRGAEAGNSRKS